MADGFSPLRRALIIHGPLLLVEAYVATDQYLKKTQPPLIGKLKKDFPDLKDADVREIGTFRTRLGRRVDFANTTPFKFDKQAAAELYSTIEAIGQGNFRINGTVNNLSYSFDITDGRQSKETYLYLLGEQYPRPDWLPAEASAVTIERSPNPNLSFVRAISAEKAGLIDERELYPDTLTVTNLGLAIEAVNVTLSPRIRSGTADTAKESICNSIGRLMTCSALGIPYEQYFASVNGQARATPVGGVVPLFALGREAYKRMSLSRLAFTV